MTKHLQQISTLLLTLRNEMSQWTMDEALLDRIFTSNPWFTHDNVKLSLQNWMDALSPELIENWLSSYHTLPVKERKSVGIVAAGNLPLVGLHDLICGVASGHRVLLKLSKDDDILLKLAAQVLSAEAEIKLVERMNDADMFIATGSNNTARYFEYYFRNKPSIIRKNRTSVAVLLGDESQEELERLAFDVYSYFGLGCRNVSKLYIPSNYDITRFIDACEVYSHYIDHHKYANNYIYHKAIFLMNQTPHLDNGFMLFKEDAALHAPLSVLFYEKYEGLDDVEAQLDALSEEIQVKIGRVRNGLPFGTSQQPGLMDYADNVDVMKFLLSPRSV